ncbi:MAG: ribosome recycling factor [Chloroflexota bacterium]
MIQEALKEAEELMKASLQSLQDDLGTIRTGRASPSLIDKLSVEYYGAPTPLMQLASISVPEPRQLLIKPFDAGSMQDIEKAIQSSDLGLTPSNDGKAIRLTLPALTEDRRRDLVKIVSSRAEESRVSIRNVRRDTIKDMRDFETEKLVSEDDLKRGEDDAQKLTDKYIDSVNETNDTKEKEVMEV